MFFTSNIREFVSKVYCQKGCNLDLFSSEIQIPSCNQAAEAGDATHVKDMIKEGVNADATDKFGNSVSPRPLPAAISSANTCDT